MTGGERPFRFFDNREKYLLSVTTHSEKWAIGQRIGAEHAPLDPRPGTPVGGYDLVIAAQPFRARHPADPKVKLVLEPYRHT